MRIFRTSRQIADGLRARIKYGVTQRDIAKELGISTAYLCDFLAGKREAGPTILKKLGFDTDPLYRRRLSSKVSRPNRGTP